MKTFFSFLIVLMGCCVVTAQDVKELHESAKLYMRQSDYNNAILVLNKALQIQQVNMPVSKDLAICYSMLKENDKALETIKPILESSLADDQCYQVAGNIYKGLNRFNDCEKLFKKGIKKFPSSGALYNELGELLWLQQQYDAIGYWEKGIENDPAYAKNYYHAARHYFLTANIVWSILYGEIFVNMEPQSVAAAEIKDIVLESYKKLFSAISIGKKLKSNNAFEKMFLQCMQKQNEVAVTGINMETLLMIRTRFMLEWNHVAKANFPFRLFELQQQLLQEGLFEAYHQWLFGAAQNLVSFQSWSQLHAQEYTSFINFHKSRLFKMRAGEYYK